MTREEVIEANKSRDVAIYRQYLHNQVRELLTDFGEISYIFFDFSYPQPDAAGLPGKGCQDWGSEELDKLVRGLQPQILINDRLNLPLDRPDVHTPEQMQPRAWVEKEGRPVFWETCQTFSGAWGYFRDETTWKSPGQLIRMLINTVACGGNLLMNVGPTARGTFDHRAQQALQVYADWMALHSRSIYGCTMSNFTAPADCRFTQNDKRLYLHVYAWPFKHLHLENLGDQVEYAQLLNDASEIAFTIDQTSNCLTLQLPVIQPEVTVPVIELFLK
jgi:alpha-L-fucosidase